MMREDISVFPLAIPMIAGPGTIATTILYVGLATPNLLNILSVAGAILEQDLEQAKKNYLSFILGTNSFSPS